MARLTKRIVDSAKPGDTVWDDGIPRFGLRVSAKGVRTYVLKYRLHGRQRWFTIGRHGAPATSALDGGVWTPERARKEALRLLGRIEAGEDPAAAKAEDRRAETLETFAARYLSDHVEPHNKPRTIEETRRNLRNHVLPRLGDNGRKRLKDITRDDVIRFHLAMKESPYAANRCLALVSHMLSKAEDWGVLPGGSTICRRIRKFREDKRRRFLSPAELARLGDALRVAEENGVSPNALAIIRLLTLTGARRSEIEQLRWSEVNLERGILELEDSKTGAKAIPLAPPAIEVLLGHPRLQSSPYVFPAASGERHFQGLMKIWLDIRRTAGLHDVRLHDLRHSFASFGASSGLGLPIIGKILGHATPATDPAP
ncbi:site-specific integrase [Hyphomonadaceae bacterium ML37]|nr:site-specific integrase [Hyphomonadaceae bacterium ML37]